MNKTSIQRKDPKEEKRVEVSVFSENISSTISFNSRVEDRDDSCEVESILKYIPPLPVSYPSLSVHHFKTILPDIAQTSFYTDSLVLHISTGFLFTLRSISKEKVVLEER